MLGATLACAALPAAVRAQIGPIQPTESLAAGARVNAFVPWGGGRPSHGLTVDLPAGWRLVEAHAVSARTNERVSLRLAASSQRERRVHALAPRALRGALRFVLGFEVGSEERAAEVTLYPLGRREDGRLIYWTGWETMWRPTVVSAPPERGRALRGDGRAVPLVLDRQALPPLGLRDAYTIEAWLKTTGLDEVVLSAWDGREGRPYPFEWSVDARGRLVVYRGAPGRHVAMATAEPVADGRWHHVALVHNPGTGWTRLYLDGTAADSLRNAAAAGGAPVALGGRAAARGGTAASPYTGLLDELRLWDRARSRDEIRTTLRRRLDEPVEGLVRLGFEEAVPPRLVAAREARITAPSDLSLTYPIEALAASVEGEAVRLTWETKDRESAAFAVERSLDGRTYTAIGELRLRDRIAEAADGTMRFAYTDVPPESPLLYYRIRQRADGPDRLSGALKLGLGGDGSPLAVILGNSPNPFATTTAVRFELGEAAPVRLSVWDVSGSRVALLFDGPLAAGRHEVRWEAGDLPSGVYFVQLQTPGTRLTHKVTLAR